MHFDKAPPLFTENGISVVACVCRFVVKNYIYLYKHFPR